MTEWLRYGQPRRYLVRLAGWLPDGRTHDRLLDFLYPDDMQISFDTDALTKFLRDHQ